MSDNPIPVKYMLYSHFNAYEKDDFESYKRGCRVEDLQGVRYLIDHFRGLKELLTSPGHEGLLVLFYAPGYERFLEGLTRREDDAYLLAERHPGESEESYEEREHLRFAKTVAECVQRKLQAERLADRVRFLTSFDLRVILGRVNTILTEQFQQFFIGPRRGIRYDAPKVMEAILRLRVLGNGIPVLRLDHDVIFRGTNKAIGDLGLFKAVACAVRAYQLRLAQPTVSTFLFSASYNSRDLLYPSPERSRFEAWARAFATRIYPALVADPKKIRRICKRSEKQQDVAWKRYVETDAYLDDTLARRFYGLKEDEAGLEPDGMSGLTSIGAHPLYSVISGALLCLSEGAILDLPPFSNLGFNVMWIDDHLKYSLHRAMNHFTSGETLDIDRGLGDARMDNVTVTKARPDVKNLPSYIFDSYLPTLLWGTVMDAWITDDSILKLRVSSLGPEELERRRKAWEAQHKALLPRAMLEALRNGRFDKASETKLEADLMSRAITRIEETRQLWAKLKTDAHNTFASYWAEGNVKEAFGKECFKKCKDDLWQGIAPGRALDDPITRLEDLSIPISHGLRDLIEDTIAYVHWTLVWPRFVQIVRYIQHGKFVGDFSWQPEGNTSPNQTPAQR